MVSQIGRADHQCGGLGTGLSLVRSLAEQHGGSGGFGLGSVSSVCLALAPPGAAAPLPDRLAESGPATVNGAPLRILAVNDNVDAASTLAELLTLIGHTAEVATTGPARWPWRPRTVRR